MIRLIASDLDGTLLQNGSTDVSEEAINLIKELTEHDIMFVAASGRAYSNLVKLFEPIKDRIAYICENGTLVKYKGEIIYKAAFDVDLARRIVDSILAKDDCEVLISGIEQTYVIPKKDSYVQHMRSVVKNDVKVIDSFDDIEEDIIKISVYKEQGIDLVSEYFEEQWATITESTVSGICWQDFLPKGEHKGKALEKLQNRFGITPDLTMCFGDNYNDITMFENAHFSYAMSSAKSEIRAKARYVAMSVENILYDVEKMINFNL